MKYQDLFSSKNLKNKNKCRLLQILLGALSVKVQISACCCGYKTAGCLVNSVDPRMLAFFG